MFQGASAISLDAKGRLSVPTKHREALRRPGDGKLVLTAHPHRCLLLYPYPAWEPIRDTVMGIGSLVEDAGLLQTLIVGFADDVEMDAAGRLLISPELREFAELDKDLMMVGQGSHFKIWSKLRWDAQIEQILAKGKQLVPAGMEKLPL